MPRFEIKAAQRPNIKVPTFSSGQMQEIGEFAIQQMEKRVATGTDVLDEPAKPLKPKYAQRKARKGLPAIRDIKLTGDTLEHMQVIEVGDNHVKIGIKGSPEYRKALFNQNIDPWFGLSGHDDQHVVDEKVAPLFHQNLADALKS